MVVVVVVAVVHSCVWGGGYVGGCWCVVAGGSCSTIKEESAGVTIFTQGKLFPNIIILNAIYFKVRCILQQS
jgi:hypothetical protein